MRPKIIAIATNPKTGVTETERTTAAGYLGGDMSDLLEGKLIRRYNTPAPIYLRVTMPDFLTTTLFRLADLDCPLVIEVALNSPYISPDLYKREVWGIFRRINAKIDQCSWPYILILGLPLDDCRDYVDAAFRVEPMTDLTGYLTDRYEKTSATVKCIHRKALIR